MKRNLLGRNIDAETCGTRLFIASLVLACCMLPLRQAGAFLVASEDFEDDLGALTSGNGIGPPTPLDLATGSGNAVSMQEGRWVTNGYSFPISSAGDTNENMAASGLSLGADPLIPSGDPTGFQGYYKANSTDYSMSGILQFTDGDGNPIAAETGDRLVGEFQVWLQNGDFSFAFIDNIVGLQAEQAANSWTGAPTASPIDIPNPQSGGPYFSNITAMVHVRQASNGRSDAVVNNGGNVSGVRLEDDIIPGPILAVTIGGQWQRITFDYTVGSSVYNNLSVERFVDTGDIGQGITTNEVRVLSDGSAVPVGDVRTSIEAIAFAGGSGGNNDYWVDEIHINLIPVSVPSIPFTNVVVNNVSELDFLSQAGRTYTLESTEDPVSGSFVPTTGETLIGNGDVLTFTDPTDSSSGKIYRIDESP